jgi:hypothetical protein
METGYYWYIPQDGECFKASNRPQPVHVHEDGTVLMIGRDYHVLVSEMPGRFERIAEVEKCCCTTTSCMICN